MTSRAVVLRERAMHDVEHAVDWYGRNACESVAVRFVEALEGALGRIARHPHGGSPRLGQELDVPGLRSLRVAGFPYLVFYVEVGAHVDVWRVLHGARDVPLDLQRDLLATDD